MTLGKFVGASLRQLGIWLNIEIENSAQQIDSQHNDSVMALDRLDHYSIRTTDLDTTRDFYVEVLGLSEGYRPTFDFPGHWLYCGERAVVHLIAGDTRHGHLGLTMAGITGKLITELMSGRTPSLDLERMRVDRF